MLDNNYPWTQASLGHADRRGNLVSRDMWAGQKGSHYSFEQYWPATRKALKLTR